MQTLCTSLTFTVRDSEGCDVDTQVAVRVHAAQGTRIAVSVYERKPHRWLHRPFQERKGPVKCYAGEIPQGVHTIEGMQHYLAQGRYYIVVEGDRTECKVLRIRNPQTPFEDRERGRERHEETHKERRDWSHDRWQREAESPPLDRRRG